MSYCVHPSLMADAQLRGLWQRPFRLTHRQMIAIEQLRLTCEADKPVKLALRGIIYCAPPTDLRKGGRS